MNNLLAGLIAGFVLALVFSIYMLVRGQSLAAFFKTDDSLSSLSEKSLSYLLLAGFILVALIFGVISGLVYGWIGSRAYFTALAFGLAGLFSLLALISRQPLVPDKIFWNLAVGGVLGVLVPLFAA
jgi:hypothetical protein